MRIQNALMELGRTGEFYAISYDKAGDAVDPTQGVSAPVQPSSCFSNEVDSLFSIDRRHGLDLILSRTEWLFELRLVFPSEVNLDFFEQEMMESPPILPAVNDLQQVILVLRRSIPKHPPTQNAANGTEVSFIFSAMLGRA